MCRKGQTVRFNNIEYRLTLKGRIYVAWLLFRERIKRTPLMRRYYLHKYPYDSTCYHCGLPWSAVNNDFHLIGFQESPIGFFTCCEHCWERMSDLEKIDSVIALHKKWEEQGCDYETEEHMLDALAQDLKEKSEK